MLGYQEIDLINSCKFLFQPSSPKKKKKRNVLSHSFIVSERSTVPPHLQPFNFHESTNTGDLIIVHCTVLKGDTPIELEWLFQGNHLNINDHVQITAMGNRVSTLTIPSVRGEHAGEYACVADNMAGRARHSAHLRVNGTFANIFQESVYIVVM